MAFHRIALLSDSEMQGSAEGVDYAAGARGSMAELVGDRISNIPGVGPLLSAGLPVWRIAEQGVPDHANKIAPPSISACKASSPGMRRTIEALSHVRAPLSDPRLEVVVV